MFYLPSLFHFLDRKAKAAIGRVSDHKDRPTNEVDFISSHHSSSSSANGVRLINDKTQLPSETKDFVSPNRGKSFQDLDHFTEAKPFNSIIVFDSKF